MACRALKTCAVPILPDQGPVVVRHTQAAGPDDAFFHHRILTMVYDRNDGIPGAWMAKANASP